MNRDIGILNLFVNKKIIVPRSKFISAFCDFFLNILLKMKNKSLKQWDYASSQSI